MSTTTEPFPIPVTTQITASDVLVQTFDATWFCEFGEAAGLQVCSFQSEGAELGEWTCAWGVESTRECRGDFIVSDYTWSCNLAGEPETCRAEPDNTLVDPLNWECFDSSTTGALSETCSGMEPLAPTGWSVSCTFTGAGAGGGFRCSGGPNDDDRAWLWDCEGDEIGLWLDCEGRVSILALIVDG